ncbi:MAG: alpha/beta fold hydrolase [Alphaproteobacteria bacterium]|nr:alpha/beta fold hydrolase [Alphaproteobacteria bacterium]
MWFNLFNRMPKPFDEGFLPAENGHSVYYVQYGNPQGEPVLSFHGGPGSSSRPKYAKLFNLKKYRFIQFDQRGCGQSKFADLLNHNDTGSLLSDAARLIKHLNINKKIIAHGVSWGSTMALLFAESNPQMVKKIVVSSVFLARPCDADWVRRDSERFYPDLWDEIRSHTKHREVYDGYYRMLFSPRVKDNLTALSYLGSYEHKLGELNPRFTPLTELDEGILRMSRIYFHYDRNNFFIGANQILKNAAKIKNIPALILHNRMDFCCPVKQAWDLHKALPKSKLTIMPEYGHSNPKLIKEVKRQLKNFL